MTIKAEEREPEALISVMLGKEKKAIRKKPLTKRKMILSESTDE